MPRIIPQEIKNKLIDKEWLLDMHVQQLFSIVEIAKILNVTPAVVTKALRSHSIQTPSQQALREASNKRKYGVVNPGSVKEFRDKALDTMTKKYGGHNWSKEGNRKKRNETCLERYGSENVGQTQHSINKAKETNLKKFGRFHVNQTHIPLSVIEQLENKEWLYEQHIILSKSLTQIAAECGLVDMTIIMNRLRKFGIDTHHFQKSFEEKQIIDYIKTLGVNNIVTNDRKIIPPKEIDLYLPDYNIAFEYCGLFWHGELNNKDRHYHQDKLKACNKQGIRLVTIYSDEWNLKKECVKQKIAFLLNRQQTQSIYARQCNVKQITNKEKKIFFNRNHIQGDGPSSLNYGLFLDNICVAVIAFVNNNNSTYTLNRYATSCNVPGGFTKLLSHFCKNNVWSKIVTFADLRWSEGKLYQKAGFVCDKILPPDYSYIINNKTHHKFAFRRKYLTNKLKNFDPNLSEWENCKKNNIDRIWDCGKKRYTLNNITYKI